MTFVPSGRVSERSATEEPVALPAFCPTYAVPSAVGTSLMSEQPGILLVKSLSEGAGESLGVYALCVASK